jgi:CheY-specific phosphatase CheX
MIQLQVDSKLVEAVMHGTINGLSMTGVVPVPVGASRLFQARHSMAVIVGLSGRGSGNMTINLSESGLRYLAGRLMGEEVAELDEDTIDAVMELGNMTAGCIKEQLTNTEFEVSAISLPSLIIGQSYNVMYARGLHTASVEFELTEFPVTMMSDRLFSVTVSLLRVSGGR